MFFQLDMKYDVWVVLTFYGKNEPRHEKTNVLHMRKQRRRSASR